ncbi:hypothetical protein GJ744_007975 [Endocarpon pusillum]|uniref:Uncharacterized protein n=1 Tax=Endocarpon pusillum TaxID=364733 RepID=A0A8H7E4U0_9EURO|nr:hypothetical protein GJ744_007975 [Endocarpon pusillum]
MEAAGPNCAHPLGLSAVRVAKRSVCWLTEFENPRVDHRQRLWEVPCDLNFIALSWPAVTPMTSMYRVPSGSGRSVLVLERLQFMFRWGSSPIPSSTSTRSSAADSAPTSLPFSPFSSPAQFARIHSATYSPPSFPLRSASYNASWPASLVMAGSAPVVIKALTHDMYPLTAA